MQPLRKGFRSLKGAAVHTTFIHKFLNSIISINCILIKDVIYTGRSSEWVNQNVNITSEMMESLFFVRISATDTKYL